MVEENLRVSFFGRRASLVEHHARFSMGSAEIFAFRTHIAELLNPGEHSWVGLTTQGTPVKPSPLLKGLIET